MINHANSNLKKFAVAFLISNKIDFKTRKNSGDPFHTESIHQEDLTIENVHVPTNRTLNT